MKAHEALLREFDGSVCPACHHRAHDPGSCSECPRCELHTDEALAFVLRYEPSLLAEMSDTDALAILAKRGRVMAILVPKGVDAEDIKALSAEVNVRLDELVARRGPLT